MNWLSILKKSRRTRHLAFIFCLSLVTLILTIQVTQLDWNGRSLVQQLTHPALCKINRPFRPLPRRDENGYHKLHRDHPRVTCIDNTLQNDCDPVDQFSGDINIGMDCFERDSIPKTSDSEDYTVNWREDVILLAGTTLSEIENCTLADPSYQQMSVASAPTCNEVHSMGLISESLKSLADETSNSPNHKSHLELLGTGGYNSVWKHQSYSNERVIMKMHKPSREFTETDFDRNRRDVLISGKVGRPPDQYDNNVLPVYQYCGFTLVVPLASTTLDEYVRKYFTSHNNQLMNATEMFLLAYQAARGLYQSHLYLDGKATTAHSDVKPSQFLLYEPPSNDMTKLFSQASTTIPLLQINDFNRCRFLQRDKNNETCPFRMCGIKHKGSTYRSPEEYQKCADQKDSIDVFSIGGVFYYLLSDGSDPYYYRKFDSAVKQIIAGKLPPLPPLQNYEKRGAETVAFVEKRNKHPAFIALQEIMLRCWSFNPDDRPSSFGLLKMFDSKRKEVFASLSHVTTSQLINK